MFGPRTQAITTEEIKGFILHGMGYSVALVAVWLISVVN